MLKNYMHRDCREFLAPCYYICLKTCKTYFYKNDNVNLELWKDLPFEHFMWIVNTANIDYIKKYLDIIIPYDFLRYYDDGKFFPNIFDTSWSAEYFFNKNGTIKRKNGKPIIKDQHPEYTWEDYISEAAFESLNKAILKWKIYGKFFVAIQIFLYSIKSKIFKTKEK